MQVFIMISHLPPSSTHLFFFPSNVSSLASLHGACSLILFLLPSIVLNFVTSFIQNQLQAKAPQSKALRVTCTAGFMILSHLSKLLNTIFALLLRMACNHFATLHYTMLHYTHSTTHTTPHYMLRHTTYTLHTFAHHYTHVHITLRYATLIHLLLFSG